MLAIVPVIGWIFAGIGGILLSIRAVEETMEVSTGVAVLVVLIPVVVFAALAVMVLLFVGAMAFGGAMAG